MGFVRELGSGPGTSRSPRGVGVGGGASLAGGRPRMAVVGRGRDGTAGLMLVALEVPVCVPGGGAAAAADGRGSSALLTLAEGSERRVD